jgi:tripartite-type tricarboxylate transporter receptor subunit TctC
MISRRELVAFGGAIVAGISPAFSQSWPTRVVRLVVPYAPGGTTDAVARIVAERLSSIWGQQVFIENKPGQGTNIGAETVARADSDGYTMLVVASSMAANKSLYRNLKYDLTTDLAPVSLLVTFPLLFYVPNSSPVKTISDLIELAKEKHGGLSYGTPGVGSINHLTGELFKRSANIEMTHVPYRGDALAITDIIAGRLDLQIGATAQLDQARSGRVRVIAISTAERLPFAPELPTVSESGLPGFNVRGWFALAVPAKVPADRVKKMSDDTRAALSDADVRSKLEAIGTIVSPSTPDELREFIAAEIEKWKAVVSESGIKLDN